MSTSTSRGGANDAAVQAEDNAEDPRLQEQREIYADQAEDAVGKIESTIKHLQDSLSTAKSEAKRLRAEAEKGKGK